MPNLIEQILSELEYSSDNGIIDFTKVEQVSKLEELLRKNGITNYREIAEKTVVHFMQLKEKQEYTAAREKELAGILKQKIQNPETKNPIQVSTALGYGKSHPAYAPAMRMLAAKKFSEKDIELVDAEPEEEKPTQQRKGKKSEPKKLGGSELESGAEERQRKSPEEIQKTSREVIQTLYGKQGKGPLLQESKTSDAALQNGYVEGSWWVAPGNAGSNYNENMSNEAACILSKYPELDEDELAMVIFNRTKDTQLAKEQKPPVIQSKDKINVPPGLTKEEQIIYKNAVITARSGRSKYNRVKESVEAAKKQAGFGNQVKITGHGGTSRKSETPSNVTTDRENILSKIDSAKTCLIYDSQMGRVVNVPKQILKDWVNSSGGGENAADTVVLAVDEKGNLMYEGWSDKKTLADLQANSTLNNDMTRSAQRVNSLQEQGLISEKNAKTAKIMVLETQKKIAEIEKGYRLVSQNNSKYFLKIDSNDFSIIENEIKNDTDIKKHYNKFNQTYTNIINGNGKADSKSVSIAEEVCGIKRKKSEEEKKADIFIQEQLDIYGEEDVRGLLKNPDVTEDVKKSVNKARETGTKSRKEYINWFNNVWLKDKSNKQKIKETSPFKILCQVSKNNPNDVSTDERKIIERAAERERQKYIKDNKNVPSELKTAEKLSALRKTALDEQRQLFKQLEGISAKTKSGKKTNMAALLGFEDAKDALHLDKINMPKDDKDFHQILKRSTYLAMEGISISPKVLQECLGVQTTDELQDYFVIGYDDERYITSPENPKIITGKVVALYMIDKDNKKKEISPKAFRSKQGASGTTSNTLAWSKEMQECFDSKK